MDRFSPEVSDKLKYYVYRLIDPRNGQTFYVGRGQGDRVFTHVNADREIGNDVKRPTEKLSTIHDIRLAGLEPIHVIHRHGIPEAAVAEVEAALIDCYPGLTNEIAGEGSSRGPANAQQLEQRYSLKKMKPHQNHRLVFVKVSKETVHARGSLYRVY